MLQSLNVSNISMALRCGEQFRRRYIEGEKTPPSVAAGRGIGVHRANDENLSQKIVTGDDMPEDALTDCARDAFVHTFRNGVFLPKDQVSEKAKLLNNSLNETIRLTRLYRKDVAPQIKPLSSEEMITVDIGLDLPIRGILDHMEEDQTVGDLKTGTRSWGPFDAQKELQPVFYSFLVEHQYGFRPKFRYDVLIALKNEEKKQKFTVNVKDHRISAMMRIIGRVIAMLKAGVFLPSDPSSWWCSERWCGYYLTCPYVGYGNRHKKWV